MNKATWTLALVMARRIEEENLEKTAKANAKAIVDELEKRASRLI